MRAEASSCFLTARLHIRRTARWSLPPNVGEVVENVPSTASFEPTSHLGDSGEIANVYLSTEDRRNAGVARDAFTPTIALTPILIPR